jgi:hypothetical protein
VIDDEDAYEDAELVDEEADEPKPPRLPLIEEVSITTWPNVGVVASTGLATGALTGSARDLAVATGVALAVEFTSGLRSVVQRKREDRALEALEFVSDLSGRPPNEVVDEVLADPRLAELAEAVLEAATLKSESLHRKALAHCLANGLDDRVTIDLEQLVTRVLRDLTIPHVELLARLSLPQPKSGAGFVRWPIYKIRILEAAMPGMATALDPLVSTLGKHGLVVVDQASSSMFSRTAVITDFGWHVLHRLMDEGLTVTRPKGEPIRPTRHRVHYSGPAEIAEVLVKKLDDAGTHVEDEPATRMRYPREDSDHVTGYLACIGHADDMDRAITDIEVRANIGHMQGGGPKVITVRREDVDS